MNATNRTILLYDVFAPPSHPNHPSLAPQKHPSFLIATTGHRFSLPVKSLPLTRNDITSGQRFTPRTESLLKGRSISDLSLPRPAHNVFSRRLLISLVTARVPPCNARSIEVTYQGQCQISRLANARAWSRSLTAWRSE